MCLVAGHNMTATYLRKRVSDLAGAGAVAVIDAVLRLYANKFHVQYLPSEASRVLQEVALLDLPAARRCQSAIGHTAALVELIYGVQGGPDSSTCVAGWLKQLAKGESLFQRTLRTLEAQAAAWDAAVDNLTKAGDRSAHGLPLAVALAGSDKFRGFVEGGLCAYVEWCVLRMPACPSCRVCVGLVNAYNACCMIVHSARQCGLLMPDGRGHAELSRRWQSLEQLWAQLLSWLDAVEPSAVRCFVRV
jgi:hypothetical protein